MVEAAAPPVRVTNQAIGQALSSWIQSIPDSHTFSREMDALKEEHRQSVKTMQDEHRLSIKTMQDEYRQSIKSMQDEHRADIQGMQDEHRKIMKTMQDKHHDDIKSLQDQRDKDMESFAKSLKDVQQGVANVGYLQCEPNEFEDNLETLQTQVDTAHRTFVRWRNARATNIHSVIYPVCLPNGAMPENFPRTNLEFIELTEESCTKFLEDYKLSSEGSYVVKQRRLAEWVGIEFQRS